MFLSQAEMTDSNEVFVHKFYHTLLHCEFHFKQPFLKCNILINMPEARYKSRLDRMPFATIFSLCLA